MRTDQSIINRYTVTAGVLSYPVTFPLFEQGDVLVMLSTDGGATERALSLNDDYSVAINDGQTGGTVTLKSGVAQAGNIIAFLSNVPYTQELDLSNVATIDVNATERQLDRTTQQVQQVRELATRHITVPATSSTKPDELLAEIFTAQRESIASAASAASSAAAAGASEKGAAAYLAQMELAKTEAVAAIQDQQSASEAAVEDAGDAQAVRLEQLASNILVSGTAYNKEATVILDQPVAAGTVVSLPVTDDGQQMMYRVGSSTLRMGFNGTLLFHGEQFEEVGNTGSISTSVKLLFDAEAGEVLNFFVYAQNVTVVVDEASGLSIDDQKRLSAAGIKAVADEAKTVASEAKDTASATQDAFAEFERKLGEVIATGFVMAFAANSEPPGGFILCNGAAVSRTTYAKLFSAIGTTYGAGDGANTFNLPQLTDGRFIEGSHHAGDYFNPGLPNIYGYMRHIAMLAADHGGAITMNNDVAADIDTYSGATYMRADVHITASNSNVIYGASNTVQPLAVTMRYYIKY